MPLFSSMKDYVKRHRRGLFITAAIAGGSYLAGQYAATKIRDFQEKSTSERLAKENLRRRFQQNQNDCVFTVMSLLPTLSEHILREIYVEAAWNKLQTSRKQEKVAEKTRKEAEAAEAAEAAALDQPETAPQVAHEPTLAGQEMEAKDKAEVQEEKDPQPLPAVQPSTLASNELDVSVGSLTASTHSDDALASSLPGLLSKEEKRLLWEEIKLSSFTRSLTALYSITLLTMMTHVQLNLLGRFTYVHSVSMLNRDEPTIRLERVGDEERTTGLVDATTERLYLSLSWWLLHRGWKQCMTHVQAAVEKVLQERSLKELLSYEDAVALVHRVRQQVEQPENGATFEVRPWILPDLPSDEDEMFRELGMQPPANSTTWRRLVNETKDFIDSPDFGSVLRACLDEVYSMFEHHAFSSISPLGDVSRATLANLLPSVSRQAHLVLGGPEYLNSIAYIKDLQAFSAIVYTQYGDETTTQA